MNIFFFENDLNQGMVSLSRLISAANGIQNVFIVWPDTAPNSFALRAVQFVIEPFSPAHSFRVTRYPCVSGIMKLRGWSNAAYKEEGK